MDIYNYNIVERLQHPKRCIRRHVKIWKTLCQLFYKYYICIRNAHTTRVLRLFLFSIDSEKVNVKGLFCAVKSSDPWPISPAHRVWTILISDNKITESLLISRLPPRLPEWASSLLL